jgi:hypothetical protein
MNHVSNIIGENTYFNSGYVLHSYLATNPKILP